MMMNKRLVWNFEINCENSLQIPSPKTPSDDSCRWESRFFWPSDEIIILHGLSDRFCELSQYKIVHREDIYLLLPNEIFNFKLRKNELFYKPVASIQSGVVAYNKKIKMVDHPPEIVLPGCGSQTIGTLLSRIQSEGIRFTVKKEALIYHFDSHPACKFELSWLHVANQAFFSVSIESKALSIVESIRQQLIQNKESSDYITFLKGLNG